MDRADSAGKGGKDAGRDIAQTRPGLLDGSSFQIAPKLLRRRRCDLQAWTGVSKATLWVAICRLTMQT
jgi:hypothetical protein